MAETISDGLVFLPEMMDTVTLRTNVTRGSIRGRDAVQAALETVNRLVQSYTVEFVSHAVPREIRICRAVLATGDQIEISNVAVRDASGWICELHVDYDSMRENSKSLKAIERALEAF